MRETVLCDECDGFDAECPACAGTGEVPVEVATEEDLMEMDDAAD